MRLFRVLSRSPDWCRAAERSKVEEALLLAHASAVLLIPFRTGQAHSASALGYTYHLLPVHVVNETIDSLPGTQLRSVDSFMSLF